MLRSVKLALLSQLLLLSCFAIARDLTYCVAVSKINFVPFRFVPNGQELAYAMLLRSYISANPSEPGLLKAYEFSPDGTVFTGEMAKDLRWLDGIDVKPLELAEGIVKTLPFRPLGVRVKVVNFAEMDNRTFKIKFQSSIENLTGVLREALSTNSRHNRFWPIKMNNESGFPLVLGKFPQAGENRFKVFDDVVKVVPASKCLDADMSMTAELLGANLAHYSSNHSPAQSSIFLQLNTSTLPLNQRAILYQKLKKTFTRLAEANSFKIVQRIFEPGESGFKSENSWSSVEAKSSNKMTKIKIGFGQPIYKKLLLRTDWGPEFDVRLVELPSTEDVDAQILPAGMEKGRHLFLQDMMDWPHSKVMLAKAPQTYQKVLEIAKRSASTIPPDDNLLSEFEAASIREVSFAPLARRSPIVYSKAANDARIIFTTEGELTFERSKP